MSEDENEHTAGIANKPEPVRANRKPKAPQHAPKKSGRSRVARIYPAMTFEAALKLAEGIQMHASGERVNRLTLCKALNMSPTSSATQILITSSGKYGLTKGSFVAEYLELTELGKTASDPRSDPSQRLAARFKLAVDQVKPFSVIYQRYAGKKLPAIDVLRDVLTEAKLEITDPIECINIFIVNAKFLGLLQTIAGSETLMPLAAVNAVTVQSQTTTDSAPPKPSTAISSTGKSIARPKWQRTCFYISPIGEEGSENRKHADLFLSSLVEPAMKLFDLDVIRADQIGEPGMITAQVLEHIFYSRLVVVDLSFHNPNVFYEMAIRHACQLPIVQLCRKQDRLPFDVNQVRTITIDTTDIYTLVPRLETYRAEISTHIRAALEGQSVSNPISVFFPGVSMTIPKVT